jgi:hypothetical protein
MDASENGNDVFFYTSARLTGEDRDSARDIYDAHVCEPESPCPASPTPPPVECEGDGCQQPATPPSDPTPGSLTFNGPGNPHEARPRKHPKRHKNKKPHHKRAASQRRGAHK